MVALLVLAGSAVLMQMVSPDWGLAVVAGALGLVMIETMSALALVGPYVAERLARRQLTNAEGATEIIASRGVLESPTTAWRQVSGIALVCFVIVPAGSLLGYLNLIERSGTAIDAAATQVLTDIRTAIVAVLVVSFVLVACSVAVTQAAAILERRDLYVSLDRIGIPVSLLAKARRAAILVPFRVASVGSATVAAMLCWWLVLNALTAPLFGVATIAAIAGGEGLVRAALTATGPVVGDVLTHPEQSI